MSEQATEELVPLADTEEQGAEATEATTEETPVEEEVAEAQPEPKAPAFDKHLQRFQEKQANQARELAEIKKLLLAQANNKPQTAAAKDRLDTLLEKVRTTHGEQNPDLVETISALAEELRTERTSRSSLQSKLDELSGSTSFAKFLVGKPPEFESEFREAQNELREAAIAEYGEEPTARELRLAMTTWTRNWEKQHASPTVKPKAVQARSQIVPTGSGPRGKAQVTLDGALKSGKVPDGKGGYRDGNLLGI